MRQTDRQTETESQTYVLFFIFRCKFDYIAISSINNQGYKEPKFFYCGSATPRMYISTYSKLEIIFHSDFTKTAKGFLGHYEFIGKSRCFYILLCGPWPRIFFFFFFFFFFRPVWCIGSCVCVHAYLAL